MSNGRIAIFGYYGFANTGDEAILGSMVGQLKTAFPERPLLVFSGNPEYTGRTHGVESRPAAVPADIKEFLSRMLGRARGMVCRSLAAFLGAKVLIVGGGGLFFDHPDYNIYLMRLLRKMNWAKRLGMRVAVIGVGVGPLYHEQSRDYLRKTLSRVDLITVREPESRQLLDELDVSGPPIHVTADLAFLLESATPEAARETLERNGFPLDDKPRIAVCLCGRHADRPDYRRSVIRFCRTAIERIDARIWFLPFQTGAGYDDRPGMRIIADELDQPERIHFFDGADDPAMMLAVVKEADLVLGERFHAAIFALVGNVPLIGISYFPKVERLFQEIGHPEWCINLEEISSESLVAIFDLVWDHREAIKRDMATAVVDMKTRSAANIELLTRVVNS